MARTIGWGAAALGLAAMFTLAARTVAGSAAAVALPNPALDAAGTAHAGEESVVFSGGCFWGVQAVFEHVKGVTSAVSGYAGGPAKAASYDAVSGGDTGHAESVKITYDPSQVSYGQLLKVFFSVAHDPTELNKQGPDHGPQYRSAVWYTTDAQKRTTEAYIKQLDAAKTFKHPIVTQVAALKGFYPAEEYHQDFAIKNPNHPYIVINDAPKVANLKRMLPELYRETPVTVAAATAER